MSVLLVGVGGALGALARFGIGVAVTKCCDVAFPLGTLIANVLGCFLIGVLIGSRIGEQYSWVRSHLGVGFLGSLTTFSTFTAETIALFHEDRWMSASANVGVSLIAGLLAVACGIVVGKKFAGLDAAS